MMNAQFYFFGAALLTLGTLADLLCVSHFKPYKNAEDCYGSSQITAEEAGAQDLSM